MPAAEDTVTMDGFVLVNSEAAADLKEEDRGVCFLFPLLLLILLVPMGRHQHILTPLCVGFCVNSLKTTWLINLL